MFKKIFGSLLGNNQNNEAPKDRLVESYNQNSMDTAIAAAQKTLPEYLKFYQSNPNYAYNHRVKVLFEDKNGGEHIWVGDFKVNGNELTGIVNNEPQLVDCVENGDKVTISLSQVTDWGFQAGNVQYGNYSVYVLFASMSKQEADSYINVYGFTNNPLEKENMPFSEIIKGIDTTPIEFEDEYDDDDSTFDSVTLHGTHYTPEQFDAEVEKRTQAWIAKEESDFKNNKPGVSANDFDANGKMKQALVDNIYWDYRRELYKEWNQCDGDQYIRFENNERKQQMQKNASDNPLLAPVHGISLYDYTAMCLKISSGVDYIEVCKAMGIEPVIWEELNTIWPQRMAEDTTYTVTTLFGQYYAEPATNPKLEGVNAVVSEEGKANLEKMKTDQYFYEELVGARQAAYEYGMDGAQWILENYGINLADFQSVAMQNMENRNANWNSSEITHYHNYREEKQKEYASKFAAEQGGNVADDVEY